jgi:hypothetical protein
MTIDILKKFYLGLEIDFFFKEKFSQPTRSLSLSLKQGGD